MSAEINRSGWSATTRSEIFADQSQLADEVPARTGT